MRIYVDFDDVLCETARSLSKLAESLFGHSVPYEQISFFDLRSSFSLSPQEITNLMNAAHSREFLSGLPPTPQALQVLQILEKAGHEIAIVTGRPASSHEGSERWLARHGIGGLPFYHVDKYGRAGSDSVFADQPPTLTIEDLYKMRFDVAIDDAPEALDLLAGRSDCRVLVFDRPWNRSYPLAPNMRRTTGWQDILARVNQFQEKISVL